VERLFVNALLAHLEQRVRAAQHARRRAAHLHMRLPADRREQEHGVEGRDLEHADARHVEDFGDMLDRLLRQPAARLLLRAPEQRDHRRLLAPLRIARDHLVGPGAVLRREGKRLRLQFGRCEAAIGHVQSFVLFKAGASQAGSVVTPMLVRKCPSTVPWELGMILRPTTRATDPSTLNRHSDGYITQASANAG
jgi:hypothetical protein